MGRNSKTVFAAALLGSSALISPSVAYASAPAPEFITPDLNSVDLTTGLVWFGMEEGGIGSGPGRVAMQRIFAEGAGWVDNWSGGLFKIKSGTLTKAFVQIDGISETFTSSGSNWINDNADGATLTIDPSGYYYFTSADGTAIKFINSPVEQSGDSCPGANPDTCQVPIEITYPSGLKFVLDWKGDHICIPSPPDPCADSHLYRRLTSVSSSAGYKLTVAYSADDIGPGPDPNPDWFKRAQVVFGNSANPPSPAPIITYAYGTNTVDVTGPEDRTWRFTTDTAGRLTGIQRPGNTSDNYGFAYGPVGTVTSATQDGISYTYDYAISGSTATMTRTDTQAVPKHITVITDLTKGRPTSYQDERGKTTSYQYDSNSRLKRITQPETNYTSYEYDSRGNVTKVTNVPKSGSDLLPISNSATFEATCSNVFTCNKPTTTTDGNGNVTDYTFSPTHGQLRALKLPAPAAGGIRPLFTYNYAQASGSPVWQLSEVLTCQTTATCAGTADQVKTAIAYNSNLLPVSLTKKNGTGTLVATTGLGYDSRGNLTSVDGPLSGPDIWAYQYDQADRLIGIISPDPDGTAPNVYRAMRVTYRGDNQVSKREVGTTTTQANVDNIVVSQHTDIRYSLSRPDMVQVYGGASLLTQAQFGYDALARPKCSVIRMDPAQFAADVLLGGCNLGSNTNPYDRMTQYGYDEASELKEVNVAVGTPDAATEQTLTYTANGKVETLKDGENNLTTFEYDGHDRLAKTRFPNPTKGSGASSALDHEDYTYDANSNLYTLRVRNGDTINYRYDALNRLTLRDSTVLAASSYTYDNLGRMLTGTFNASGEGVTNSYDALDNLVSRTSDVGGTARQLSYAYDKAGRRTKITWPDGFHADYERLLTGELRTVTENAGTTGSVLLATYGYDDLGRQTTATYGNGTSQSYGYDGISRLNSLTTNLSGSASDLTETFTYNPASQILTAQKSNNAYAYTGNSSGSISTVTNGLNEMTDVGGVTYTNDANGNLISDGANAYRQDAENKLTAVTGTGVSAVITYDPLRRISEVAGSTVADRTFLQDAATGAGADTVVAEYSSGGAMQHRYLPTDGLGAPLVDYDHSGTRTWLMTDERGSVIASANGTGAMTTINAYDEYGMPGATNSGRFQYAGQLWLNEVSLYSMRNRMYGTPWGRFLQPDPLGYGGDGPNLYAYALNDPVNFIDPLGLATGSGCGGPSIAGPQGSIIVNACFPENPPTSPLPPTVTGGGGPNVSLGKGAPASTKVKIDISCKNVPQLRDPAVQQAAVDSLQDALSTGTEYGFFVGTSYLGGYHIWPNFTSRDPRGIQRGVVDQHFHGRYTSWMWLSHSPDLFIHTHQNNPGFSPVSRTDANSAAARGIRYAAIDKLGNITCTK